MSFIEKTCLILCCDCCGVVYGEGGDFTPHFDTEADARDVALDGWYDRWQCTEEGKHYCTECKWNHTPTCSECGEAPEDCECAVFVSRPPRERYEKKA